MSTVERPAPAQDQSESGLALTLDAKDAPVGGQAVLEGVMMRGVSTWSVAVRKPVPEEEQEEITKGAWIGTFVVGIGLAIGLFFLLPALITDLSGVGSDNGPLFVFVEKLIRLTVFIGYLWLISRLPDLKRLFQYHGAEHKTISCYEAGLPLTPENAQQFSRFHPRCGTSFLLIVMIISFFVLVPIGTPEWYILYPTRILAVPLVAGLAFELIKWFGKNRRKRWAQILMWPGIQLQRLTTRDPDASQLAVAIAALEAVLAVENFDEISEEERAGLEVAA